MSPMADPHAPDRELAKAVETSKAPAISRAAQLDGYSASAGKTAPVTKEAVAAKLAEFSDDELKALGLTRKKGR